MSAMNMPGFTAEASVYKVKGSYYTASAPNRASGMREVVGLAGLDDCDRCSHLSGCARKRCFCECGDNPGICIGPCCRFCT